MEIHSSKRVLVSISDPSLKCEQQGTSIVIVNGEQRVEGEPTTNTFFHPHKIEEFAQKTLDIIDEVVAGSKEVYLRCFSLTPESLRVRIIAFSPMPEGFVHDVTKDKYHPEYMPQGNPWG